MLGHTIREAGHSFERMETPDMGRERPSSFVIWFEGIVKDDRMLGSTSTADSAPGEEAEKL